MKITRAVLTNLGACSEGKEWFLDAGIEEHEPGILNLLEKGHAHWANWLIVRLMTPKQKVMYACFAAQQVLRIFEKKCPKDKRPRKAIEAALNWVQNPTNAAANAAADAAANAADAAAYAAANAAYAAADAADAAANAVYAANAAVYVADAAARKKLQIKILKYGLTLLRESAQ